MINNPTIDKLIGMRLTAMAEAYLQQLSDPNMKEIDFEDRIGMMVDIEYTRRKNNRLHRLIKNAEFEQPDASIVGINYSSGRKINKDLIKRLATCEYIAEFRNIFITGATGCGKTYLANAFGMGLASIITKRSTFGFPISFWTWSMQETKALTRRSCRNIPIPYF